MKRLLKLLFIFLLTISFTITSFAEGEEETVEENPLAYVLMDADSGNILLQNKESEPRDIASLAKLMSVYVSLGNVEKDTLVTLSEDAFKTYDHNYGVLWIKQGEMMSAYSAAQAAILTSANDATAMLAEASAGSVYGVVEQMNSKAKELGLDNTNFDNPFGYHSENQYSSALDVAKLVRTFWQEEPMASVFGSDSYVIPATNLEANQRVLGQDCKLMRSDTYRYEGTLGCKVGSTNEGGFSIVALVERDNSRFIGVVLGTGSEASAYEEAIKLFEEGFSNYQTILINEEEIGGHTVEVKDGRKHVADVKFSVDQNFRVLLPAALDKELISTEVRINNEDSNNPEEISADVIFKIDDVVAKEVPMKKEIIYPDSKKTDESSFHRFRRYFDYFSVGVIGLYFLIRILIFLRKHLAPPQ